RLDGAGDAGGIDEDVDAPAERVLRALDQALHSGLVGDVGGLDERTAAELLDLPRELPERRDLPSGQRQMRPLARQGQADLGAHALGGAGHDRDAAVEATGAGRQSTAPSSSPERSVAYHSTTA